VDLIMRSIAIAELPNIDGATVKEIGLTVQKIRLTMLRSITSLLGQNARAQKAKPMIVAVAIFHRMAECALSIELLASKGMHRDAATLLLTLIELRLDLQYIALSPGREDHWLKHTKKQSKPWRVAQQIKEIFKDKGEQDGEMANYCTFSMVKHGNPAGGNASFPFGPLEDGLVLPDADQAMNLLAVYLFAVGTTLCQAAVAAACPFGNAA